jgi:alkanesulfonate monooxygenase SsuD/methylene tetrahydromethanopterin reductase-like flavin-dependent oxidoreductase (luciferase family)
MQTVKELCDGWMMLSAGGNPEKIKAVLSDPEWPTDRPMTLVKGARIVVAESRDEAVRQAQGEYEGLKKSAPQLAPPTFEDFLEREVIGTPDECLAKIRTFESWGVNYLRVNFSNAESQAAVARLILPRLAEEPLAVS